MATIEKLLVQYLAADTTLAGFLSTWNQQPAIFVEAAPPDSDSGWAAAQTPRLEFIVTRQDDPERGTTGELHITIVHLGGSTARAMDIEARLRALLNSAAYQVNGETLLLRWAEAEVLGEDEDRYREITAIYDLHAFPSGATFSPDPVAGLNAWTAASWPNLQVNPATWAPTDTAPALYWRLAAIEQTEPQPWGGWITARLNAHILAPTPGVRLQWVRKIVEQLAMNAQVALDDGSPLTVQALGADTTRDILRVGQVQATVRFGILAAQPTYQQLNTANNTVKLTEVTT